MKLSKLIKNEYKEYIECLSILPNPLRLYEVGFEDGIFNMFLTMKDVGVHPDQILEVIDTIDPKHTTIAWELAEEYFIEYYEQVE